MKVSSKDVIRNRIHNITSTSTQGELSNILDKSQSAISSGLSKKIPFDWFHILFTKFKANPLWILTGEGEKTINTFPNPKFHDDYKTQLKLNESLSLKQNIEPKHFVVAEPDSHELLNDFDNLDMFGVNVTNLLDNSSNNELNSRIRFSVKDICTAARIFSLDSSKPYTPIIINYSNRFVENETIRFFKFDSACMEPNIAKGIICVETNAKLDFDTNFVYVFAKEGIEIILARVKLENNMVLFLFDNENFEPYSCTITEATNDFIGKAVSITNSLN